MGQRHGKSIEGSTCLGIVRLCRKMLAGVYHRTGIAQDYERQEFAEAFTGMR